jgi:hypothetical protein
LVFVVLVDSLGLQAVVLADVFASLLIVFAVFGLVFFYFSVFSPLGDYPFLFYECDLIWILPLVSEGARFFFQSNVAECVVARVFKKLKPQEFMLRALQSFCLFDYSSSSGCGSFFAFVSCQFTRVDGFDNFLLIGNHFICCLGLVFCQFYHVLWVYFLRSASGGYVVGGSRSDRRRFGAPEVTCCRHGC